MFNHLKPDFFHFYSIYAPIEIKDATDIMWYCLDLVMA